MENLENILNKYIEEGKYPGIQWKIIQKNSVNQGLLGYKNLEKREFIESDTLYRIWSMTKPIVSLAAMQFVENKKLNLNDPITYYLPEFSNLKVLKNLNSKIEDVVDLKEQPTIKNLLLHTAGFSYNFLPDPIGFEYDRINLFGSFSSTLEEEIKLLSDLPLLFQPSTRWCYSVSTDVLGRILEVITGTPLQQILNEQIFIPLEMNKTGFSVSDANTRLLMNSYEFDPLKNKLTNHILEPQRIGKFGHPINNKNYARGGHGLYSTVEDFMNFVQMLHTGKNKHGKYIISKKLIDLMSKNHLESKLFPIEILNISTKKDENYTNDLDGYGWGFGFRTLMSPEKNNYIGNKGEFGWSGAASTYFLVDVKKEISAVLMTQVLNGDVSLKKDFYKFIYCNY